MMIKVSAQTLFSYGMELVPGYRKGVRVVTVGRWGTEEGQEVDVIT